MVSAPKQAARVAIARVLAADRDTILAANRANRDYHAPWVAHVEDEATFEVWFAKVSGEAHAAFLAREIASGAPVGIFHASQIVRGFFESCYLGYHGYRETGGRGLVGEALELVLAELFGAIGLHRVEANICPENLRSIALVRRAGFRKEGFSPRYLKIGGVWRDHERWAIIAEDREAP